MCVCKESVSFDAESEMLGVLLPLFISCLTPSPSSHQALHTHSLQRLMAVGPKYPEPFKNIVQANPSLRQQLENAIRAGQGGPGEGPDQGDRRGAGRTPQVQAPSIKLKKDFSNFK